MPSVSAVEGSFCRGQTAKILVSLGSEGFKSKCGFDLEGGVLNPPLQGTSDKKRICQFPQEQLPEGHITFPAPKTSSG